MSTTITVKLNKDASEFPAGESIGFGVRGGVQYYDRETKQKEWTNYQAVIFARAEGQIQFYRDNLREGAIIELSGKSQKIKQFQGQNGLMLSIELIEASIGFVSYQQPVQQPQQAPARQAPPQYQQPAQQTAPQQAPARNEFEDDLPF